jgi:hypothetical protein
VSSLARRRLQPLHPGAWWDFRETVEKPVLRQAAR